MTGNLRFVWLNRALIILGVICLVFYSAATVSTWRYQRDAKAAVSEMIANPVAAADKTVPAAPRVLKKGDLIGRVDIPRINLSAAIAEGDDDKTLGKAVGHLPDTPQPWHRRGNVAFAAHRDGLFRKLEHVRIGDVVHVVTIRGEFHYRVTKTQIVESQRSVGTQADEDPDGHPHHLLSFLVRRKRTAPVRRAGRNGRRRRHCAEGVGRQVAGPRSKSGLWTLDSGLQSNPPCVTPSLPRVVHEGLHRAARHAAGGAVASLARSGIARHRPGVRLPRASADNRVGASPVWPGPCLAQTDWHQRYCSHTRSCCYASSRISGRYRPLYGEARRLGWRWRSSRRGSRTGRSARQRSSPLDSCISYGSSSMSRGPLPGARARPAALLTGGCATPHSVRASLPDCSCSRR